MDNKTRQKKLSQLRKYVENYESAKHLGNEAQKAAIGLQILKISSDLAGVKLNLSADPLKLVIALDLLSVEGQLERHGLENDPEVRKLLGLPPINPMTAAKDLFDGSKEVASPIILDLDGDGVETTNINFTNVYFDHASDGFAELTGWVGKDDGLLVYESKGSNLDFYL